jgi:hypothetical protein
MGVDVGRGLSARRHALGKCHPKPTSELELQHCRLQATARAHAHAHGRPRLAHRLTRCLPCAVRLAPCVLRVASCVLHLPRCLARRALCRCSALACARSRRHVTQPILIAARPSSCSSSCLPLPCTCPALACFGPSAIRRQDHLSLSPPPPPPPLPSPSPRPRLTLTRSNPR